MDYEQLHLALPYAEDWTNSCLPYALAQRAISLLGAPSIRYRNKSQGMDPETGFDCSGFINYLFTLINKPLPTKLRHANQLFDQFGVLTHEPRRGDLVFFTKNGLYPSHVGIMLDPLNYIHAPGKIGTFVTISQTHTCSVIYTQNKEPWENLYKENPIGFKRPTFKQNERWARVS